MWEVGVRSRLFAGLGGSVDAYGAMKDDNLVVSAVAGSESTSYSYACVSVERLSALCVCWNEFTNIGIVRLHRSDSLASGSKWNMLPEQSRTRPPTSSHYLFHYDHELCI